MDIVPVDVHVGEVERSVRTTKERVRCTIQGLPYQWYPAVLMKGVVDNATRCLNQLPAEDGLSNRISPMSIVTGVAPVDYTKLTTNTGGAYRMYKPSIALSPRT